MQEELKSKLINKAFEPGKDYETIYSDLSRRTLDNRKIFKIKKILIIRGKQND